MDGSPELALRCLAAVTLAVLIGVGARRDAHAQSVTFENLATGAPPPAFEMALTGGGKPPRWEIVADSDSSGGKALAELSQDTTDYRFPLAIYTPLQLADVEATIRFKPVSGAVDQAGGIVVRFRDGGNYYVARANALEDNVNFYRVVAGKRQLLAGARTKVTSGEWHTLTLRAQGTKFTVLFDGKPMHTTDDTTFATPGKIGLWTKADSVTRFDRIEIKQLP